MPAAAFSSTGIQSKSPSGLREIALVVDEARQVRLRHVRRVREDDDAPHGGDPVADRFEDRQEGQVREDHAILGMADDPGDLLVEQARVQRVVDKSRSGDAVPAFEMPPAVPGEGGHPFALSQPLARQPLRQPERPRADLGVIRLVDRSFDGA